MTQPLVPLAASLGLLLAGAAILLLRDKTTSRLRDRIKEVADIHAAAPTAASPSIRVTAPDERGTWQRFASFLGYNPHLPREYAASIPLVAGASSVTALIAFWRTSAAFGEL